MGQALTSFREPFAHGPRPMSFPTANATSRGRPPAPAVLLGWELGDGFGHLQRLGRLARALADAGLRPVLAVKDLALAGTFFHAFPFPVLQAPVWPPRPVGPEPFLAGSFADVLAIRGFAAADDLWP